MVDFSDGWFMLPLRVVQLANSLIGIFPLFPPGSTGFIRCSAFCSFFIRTIMVADGLVLVCAVAGRVNLPGFVSAIHAQDIILVAVRILLPILVHRGKLTTRLVYHTSFHHGHFNAYILRFQSRRESHRRHRYRYLSPLTPSLTSPLISPFSTGGPG